MSDRENIALSTLESPQMDEAGTNSHGQIAEEKAMSKSPIRGEAPVRKVQRLSWFFVVFSLLAALFLFALDNTIVANVQENIIYTLGGIEKLSWISVAFSLGAVATNLFWGQLYSHFDSKLLFISSVIIFEAGGHGLALRVKSLDLVGTILSAGAITAFVMAISFGGSVYAWDSGQIIGLFVTTGVIWIAFVVQQRYSLLTTPENRLFPASLLKSWEMDIIFAQMASAQVVVTVPVYFIPLYFQFAKDASAMRSGVQLLPFVLPLVFAVMLNGSVMAQVGYYMPWYLGGSALALAGSALLYTINAETNDARIYGYSVLTAFGVGMFSQAGFAIAQMKATPKQLAQAVAFIGIGQVGGITLALTMSNSIFLNESTDKLAKVLPDLPRSALQQAVSGFGADFFQSLTSDERQRVLAAIIESIDNTFIMVITACAFSLVLSVFMKREKLFVLPKQ
ncbi:hypothetical protein VMCG_10547 [Cytospora schulzeri]|uniref:Major facilitator superfamily (MFS) profile domain-containing protein n=1 Tax=Cytospora schulzeri TaxID=448051 RepID=A0A423VAA0_9PEZI|nr:hypothetical protein VMCG_10547 [Valsa malicola]